MRRERRSDGTVNPQPSPSYLLQADQAFHLKMRLLVFFGVSLTAFSTASRNSEALNPLILLTTYSSREITKTCGKEWPKVSSSKSSVKVSSSQTIGKLILYLLIAFVTKRLYSVWFGGYIPVKPITSTPFDANSLLISTRYE